MIKSIQQLMQSERLPLWANFSWAFVGNSIFSFSQLGLLIAVAKLGSPEMVGTLALANAITAPVFMLGNFDLAVVQNADVHNTKSFSDYLGFRLICSLLGIIFIAGVLWASGYEKEIVLVTFLISLNRFVESLSDASYGLIQKQERLDLVARSLIIRGVIPLLTATFALYVFHSLSLAVFTELIVWISILGVYDLPNVRRWQTIRPRFNFRIMKTIFWLALPLGIVAGLNSLSSQIPRYAMEHFDSQRELGIFSAIISIGAVTSLFTGALSSSALPRFSQLYSQRAFDRFGRLLLQLIGIGIGIGILGLIGAVLFGKPLLTVLFTEEYSSHLDVLIVTMANVGVVAAFTFVGVALSSTRRFAIQPLIHIIKVTSIGLACLVLIPQLGALGAAWAAFTGSLISGLIYSFILWRTLNRTENSLVQEV